MKQYRDPCYEEVWFCRMEDAVDLIERYKLNEGKFHKTEYIYL